MRNLNLVTVFWLAALTGCSGIDPIANGGGSGASSGSGPGAGTGSSGSASGNSGAGASGSNPGTPASGSCTQDSDCGTNEICGFLESVGCSAIGKCFPAPQFVCLAYAPGCACDGTTVSIACTGLPDGYSPKALSYAGVCSDAGPGANPGPDAATVPAPDAAPVPVPDAGATCTSDADCGGNVCGFPSSAACSAKGTCFPAALVTCLAYAPGCACDGSEINITCNGLPDGYETKPLEHTGSCVDGG